MSTIGCTSFHSENEGHADTVIENSEECRFPGGGTIEACKRSKTDALMFICIENQTRKVDRVLSDLVEKTKKNFHENEPGLSALFSKNQDNWNSYITSQCKVENYYSYSGSAYEIYHNSCLINYKLKRIAFLKQLVHCP